MMKPKAKTLPTPPMPSTPSGAAPRTVCGQVRFLKKHASKPKQASDNKNTNLKGRRRSPFRHRRRLIRPGTASRGMQARRGIRHGRGLPRPPRRQAAAATAAASADIAAAAGAAATRAASEAAAAAAIADAAAGAAAAAAAAPSRFSTAWQSRRWIYVCVLCFFDFVFEFVSLVLRAFCLQKALDRLSPAQRGDIMKVMRRIRPRNKQRNTKKQTNEEKKQTNK